MRHMFSAAMGPPDATPTPLPLPKILQYAITTIEPGNLLHLSRSFALSLPGATPNDGAAPPPTTEKKKKKKTTKKKKKK